MRNILKTAAVILFLSGLVFTACKKDKPMQVNQNTNTELDDHSTKVLNLIKTFDEKMNSTLKADELIHIDSVVWNIEALQNYLYAFPDTSTKNFKVYREDYSITLNSSGRAWLSDAQQLNAQMEADIEDQLDEINSNEAFLRFCDVVLDSIVSNTAYITAITGFGYNLVLGYYPFSEDDDWIWGTLGEEPPLNNPPAGKCDGTMYGVSDGSNEIEWRLNYGSNTWVGGSVGYTNVETVDAYPGDFPGTSGTRIFSDPTMTPDYCLYNEDLTYHLIEADDIIYTYGTPPIGLRPVNKYFMSIHIIDDQFGGILNGHKYEVTYGIPYQMNPN